MIIRVTNEHIRHGKHGSSMQCPVALALKEQFPFLHVEVLNSFITIGKENYALNEKLAKFLSSYDRYQPVEPFSFDLDELNLLWIG